MLFLDLILVMLDPHAIYFKITTNIQFCKEFIPEHLAIILRTFCVKYATNQGWKNQNVEKWLANGPAI